MSLTERSRSDRQAEVAEAVWRVLDRDGFVGLSLRVVAAEMGATTGTVTHYFPSKDALADYALELLASRRAEGETAAPSEPLAALRTALLGMLPLDPASRSATRIWVSSWMRRSPTLDARPPMLSDTATVATSSPASLPTR
jgi:AcrR family transcriptional regulator